MPARTEDNAETTGTASDICALVNQHATLLDGTLIDASIPANGTLRLTQSDGSTFDNSIPLFSDFVISGLNVTQQASPNLNQFQFSAGQAQIDAQVVNVGSPLTATLGAGDATNPRVDIVSMDTAGTLTVTAGTPSANPVQPTTPAGELLLLVVFVEAGAGGSTGGYTILEVNSSQQGGGNVAPGTSSGPLLEWSDGNSLWQPESKVVLVRSLEDLPSPSGGTIELVDGYTYLFVGSVDIGANTLLCELGDYALIGLGGDGVSSIASTELVIVCDNSDSAHISGLNIISAGSSTCLDFGNVGAVSVLQCTLTGADDAAISMGGTTQSALIASCVFAGTANGVVLQNTTIGSLVVDSCTNTNTTAAGFTFLEVEATTTVTSRIRLSACNINVLGGQTGIDIDPYATLPESGLQIKDCLFEGGGTYISGAASGDDTSYWRDNIGIAQTAVGAIQTTTGNTTATTIAAADTWTLATLADGTGATTNDLAFDCLFDQPNDNRLRYVGAHPRIFELNVRATASAASSTGDTYSLTVFKNGSAVTSIGLVVSRIAGKSSVATFGRVELAKNDYLEIYVRNIVATNNITLENTALSVKEA